MSQKVPSQQLGDFQQVVVKGLFANVFLLAVF